MLSWQLLFGLNTFLWPVKYSYYTITKWNLLIVTIYGLRKGDFVSTLRAYSYMYYCIIGTWPNGLNRQVTYYGVISSVLTSELWLSIMNKKINYYCSLSLFHTQMTI